MPIVDMKEMLDHARDEGYAVGAFDLVDLDFLTAIIDGAEACRAPVILSLAGSHFSHFDFELLMAATVAAARRATVPVAIHLDHGASLDSAVAAIRHGCNGVMVDTSHHGLAENIARTRAVVAMAHGCGVTVEGELGYVAGVEGEDAERHPGEPHYTDPEEAAACVRETGVDCLAVSIGTVHGRMSGTPRLDFERLAAIRAATGVPLVIHGGTGLDDDQFRRLIANGATKINYFTALATCAAEQLHDNAAATGDRGSYFTLRKGVTGRIRAEVERCIRLWGGAGRADAVLARARPWREVEHLIIYNVTPETDGETVATMKEEGLKVLGKIPGVRALHTGTAVQESAKYRHCWLVRFTHPAVIAGYRDHPAHLRYADEWFRPRAPERISIDFALDSPNRG